MDYDRYDSFFAEATKIDGVPYPYQRHLALDAEFPLLLKVPTGMGKTAAVILSWLWRRRFHSDKAIRSGTPRRLVYCLPMRVLAEQTHENALTWMSNLRLLPGRSNDEQMALNHMSPVGVSLLMGGQSKDDWDLYPERDTIIIGTQDMLLSRALNRGYGMSRYRWPLHFGLLNNDCLWVFDEPQLMGGGLLTSSQIQGFRSAIGTLVPTTSLWMSATLHGDWLKTVDFHHGELERPPRTLEEDDYAAASTRLEAHKELCRAAVRMGDTKNLAKQVVDSHKAGSRTLVFLNTVKRAMELHDAIDKEYKKPARKALRPKLVLLHSRFRSSDRRRAVQAALEEAGDTGVVLVSTQVLEAGVDLSARVLYTELAPWSSLVQRFGRCNRDGLEQGARVYWLDLPDDDTSSTKLAAPYDVGDLYAARRNLEGLSDAGPLLLPDVETRRESGQLIRKKDLIDLFDTTPDLAGNDVDVSRFIREGEDHDVSAFWRDISEEGPSSEEHLPDREEICPVPVGDIRTLIKERALIAWTFDALGGVWNRVSDFGRVYPGMQIMLRSRDGFYNSMKGWDIKSKDAVEVLPHGEGKADSTYEGDVFSETGWQTLREHTEEVVTEIYGLLSSLGLADQYGITLITAARWHDAGKAHHVMQESLRRDAPPSVSQYLLAKSGNRHIHHSRPCFRHELASAILALMHKQDDLVVYLTASHHGKVRLSLRSMPNEKRPAEKEKHFARGIWDGDVVPETELGGGVVVPETTIDLSCMEMGYGPYGPSWLARMIALRDELGPLVLAFLEALIKIADERASQREKG